MFGVNGKNFIKTMLTIGKKFETIRVVNDQIGIPTYTLDLSVLLVDMVETEKYGYYHAPTKAAISADAISPMRFLSRLIIPLM